jgi:hypothetical protein
MIKDFLVPTYERMTPVGLYTVFRLWIKDDEFNEASEWLTQFSHYDAHWHFGTGCSNINGVQYPHCVYFRHEADYLMFKLKFSRLLTF